MSFAPGLSRGLISSQSMPCTSGSVPGPGEKHWNATNAPPPYPSPSSSSNQLSMSPTVASLSSQSPSQVSNPSPSTSMVLSVGSESSQSSGVFTWVADRS